MLSASRTFESLSKIFIAYHLCCSSGLSCKQASSICAIACSTQPEKLCCGIIFLPLFAISIALSAAFVIPVPLRADISTTEQPSSFARFDVFITSPFFLTTSIILIAHTTGMPSSTSCVVR